MVALPISPVVDLTRGVKVAFAILCTLGDLVIVASVFSFHVVVRWLRVKIGAWVKKPNIEKCLF